MDQIHCTMNMQHILEYGVLLKRFFTVNLLVFAPLTTETERTPTKFHLKNGQLSLACMCTVVTSHFPCMHMFIFFRSQARYTQYNAIAPKPIEFNAKFPQLFLIYFIMYLKFFSCIGTRTPYTNATNCCPLALASDANKK